MRSLALAVAFVASVTPCRAGLDPQRIAMPFSNSTNTAFGSSCAVDGDVMAIGSPGANGTGYVFLYRWKMGTWTFEDYVIGGDVTAGDQFGCSVSVSGETLIVGAWGKDNGARVDQGAAYVFVRSGSKWVQQAKLLAGDGAANDVYGLSVGVSGNWAIVGAYGADLGAAVNAGAAYIYGRTGSSWSHNSKVTAIVPATADRLGYSVAISGTFAVAGAWGDDVGAVIDAGSATVFRLQGNGWIYEREIYAGSPGAGDGFGISVAIDRDLIVVGAPNNDVGANADQGSAYPFRRDPTQEFWKPEQELIAPDGAAGDAFGWSVSISAGTAAVGAHRDDVFLSDMGSVYVFTSEGLSQWPCQASLNMPDGAGVDNLGQSVAINGDKLVAGAPQADGLVGSNEGAVTAFERVGPCWASGQKVKEAGLIDLSQFGWAVAVDGDWAAIGAYNQTVGGKLGAGAVYIYRRTSAGWVYHQTISGEAAGDGFGTDVAISGNLMAVGIPGDDLGANTDQGSVWPFRYSVNTGTWIYASDWISSADGAPGDAFGFSVDIDGNTLVVGAYLDDDGANTNEGGAYVFTTTNGGGDWDQQQRLGPSDGAAQDFFGIDVALSGDSVIVGSYRATVDAMAERGAAYVFTRSGSAWSQQKKLTASDGLAGDRFGGSVDIDGDLAAVGAELAGGTAAAEGAAYLYSRTASTWSDVAKVRNPSPDAGDEFGDSVAVSGEYFATSAYHDDGAGPNEGAAYVYQVRDGYPVLLRTIGSPYSAAPGQTRLGIVALDQETLVVGAHRDATTGLQTGAAWFFCHSPAMYPGAKLALGNSYFPSVPFALQTSPSGTFLLAGAPAFWGETSFDFLGRPQHLDGYAGVRTSSGSIVSLADGASLGAAPGTWSEFFGTLRTDPGAFAQASADRLVVGALGLLNARPDSFLAVDAPVVRAIGPTRIDGGAMLSLLGSGEFYSLTALDSSTLAAGGPVTLLGTASFTNAQVATGPLTVSGQLNMTDTDIVAGGLTIAPTGKFVGKGWISAPTSNYKSMVFNGTSYLTGDLLNNAGATITIQTGTLFFTGALTNNGTITGSFCCRAANGLDVDGPMIFGRDASLLFSGPSFVRVTGDADVAVDDPSRFNLRQAELRLDGGGAIQALEAMSADIGPSQAGLDPDGPGRFPVGSLILRPSAQVELVDAHDNDRSGQFGAEAVYADTVFIQGGATLINPATRVYYNTLVLAGAVTNPENLVRLEPVCVADFNGDGFVTGDDHDEFIAAFEAGAGAADVTGDGFVTGDDFDLFISEYEAGC